MRIFLTNWEIFYLLNLDLTYICNILMAKYSKNTYIHDRLNYDTLSKSIHNYLSYQLNYLPGWAFSCNMIFMLVLMTGEKTMVNLT